MQGDNAAMLAVFNGEVDFAVGDIYATHYAGGRSGMAVWRGPKRNLAVSGH
ncbi:MAG: hypothetical protein M5U34_43415 [Chloroflexi bacterium]|nr:hypothetical protein [Chloroflexota bacterium]